MIRFLAMMILSVSFSQFAISAPKITFVQNACERSEKWRFSNQVPFEWQIEFKKYQKKKISNMQGFAEAFSLRRLGLQGDSMFFSEYWIARSLFNAKLYHMANQAFTAIASRKPTKHSIPIQIAAIKCLNKIQYSYTSIPWSAKLQFRIFELAGRLKEDKQLSSKQKRKLKWIIWDAAASMYRQTQNGHFLKILEKSGPHEFFAKGLEASRNFKPKKAIQFFRKYLKYKKIPNSLKRFRNSVKLLVARNYYEIGAYRRSARYFHSVSKSSNDLAMILSELSWAYLLDQKYGEAIGVGMSLNSGAMNETFAPEGLMVMAMSLNELCQYPQSIRAIDLFRASYKDSYYWLQDWRKKAKAKDKAAWKLYPQVIHYLKGKPQLPSRVLSEWVRSPHFLARQSEINLLIDEINRGKRVTRMAKNEQKKRAKRLLLQLRKTKKSYKISKLKLGPGEKLSKKTIGKLYALRKSMKHFYRLKASAPFWNRLLNVDQVRAPIIRKRLIHQISSGFMKANLNMVRALDRIAENNQLIEVEIFNGASQDIIWQNAHPDYEEIATKINDQKKTQNSDKIWDWGTTELGLEGSDEVWEDELGSFKADIYNNCSSKDKFLAIKSRVIRERTLVKMKERRKSFSISSKKNVLKSITSKGN